MNNPQQHLTLIGPGVMAEAIILALINNSVCPPTNITAAGPRQDRLDELTARYSIDALTDNARAVQNADVILLCIKPQKLTPVLEELRGKIPSQAFVISIVAGATLATLSGGLQHTAIVRAMPNTPAQVGEGMTVWTHTRDISEIQIHLAKQILGALGTEIYVEEESYIDMATAVSGTGPAYVFLFLEAMIDAGVHLGLPRRLAEAMVAQTIKGTIAYYEQNDSHPARLRNQVTSPGGTSATALYYLDKMGFRTAVSRAIWAAFTRSQELGRGRDHQDPEQIYPQEQ
jgi:pyrroline-5-carboxylate reductase